MRTCSVTWKMWKPHRTPLSVPAKCTGSQSTCIMFLKSHIRSLTLFYEGCNGFYRSWLRYVYNNPRTEYIYLVFTKSVDNNFRAFWLAPVTWNILGYSLICERREKRLRFAKISEEEIVAVIEAAFFYPSDLVNTKTTIPLRVGEERWIYASTLRVLLYIHHYSPPLRGIVVYYIYM